jgi:ferritin-like metal-binding protein YciE
MFEHLNTPEESFNYKLGAALEMEQTVLKILEANIAEAQDAEIRGMFEHHRSETEEHVHNLEEAFTLLGWERDTSPCPAIDGIAAEGKANAKKTDRSIIDAILLQGAVETEHHEIAVYENLVGAARAMGRDDVAAILQRNLDNEEQTLAKARLAHERVAAVTPKEPPRGDAGVMNRVKEKLTG